MAHVVSWILHNGQIPIQTPRLCVLHECDVRACVRPDHLFLGTDDDNNKDMMRKGRGKYVTHFGVDHGNSKLSDMQVLAIVSEYEAGGITQRELATKFKVCFQLVNHILTGRLWSHLTGKTKRV